MIRFFILVAVILTVAALGSCKKDVHSKEALFYGMWTKGTNFSDTLWFMEKNNKPTIKYSVSFNSGLPGYAEREYRFENGKLSLKMGNEFYPMESFVWITEGREFDIQAYQLYMFMSSTAVHFRFKKVN